MSRNLNPIVSVIIINHNYGQFIGTAIDSVLNQTYSSFELIIVDDGSTDESVKTIEQYRSSDSQICLIPHKGGPSRARNHGINLAKGEYVAFLDSDDYWSPDKLSKQIDFIQQNSLDGTYSVVELLDVNHHTKIVSGNSEIEFTRFIDSPLGVGGFLMSTLLLRRSTLLASGYFDPELNHGEDLDFAARIFRNANIKCIGIPLCTIRRHVGSLSASFDPKFLSDLTIWTDSFLSRFGSDFSRSKRLRYIYRTTLGTIKICILNRRPRLLFKTLFRITRLSRYLR